MARVDTKTPILHFFHEKCKKLVSRCLVYIYSYCFLQDTTRHHNLLPCLWILVNQDTTRHQYMVYYVLIKGGVYSD